MTEAEKHHSFDINGPKINVKDRVQMIESRSPRRHKSHNMMAARTQTRNFHPKIKSNMDFAAAEMIKRSEAKAEELTMQTIKKFTPFEDSKKKNIGNILGDKAQEITDDAEIEKRKKIAEEEEKEAALYGETIIDAPVENKRGSLKAGRGVSQRIEAIRNELLNPNKEPVKKEPVREFRRIESKKFTPTELPAPEPEPVHEVYQPVPPPMPVDPAPPVEEIVITGVPAAVSMDLSLDKFDIVTVTEGSLVDDNIRRSINKIVDDTIQVKTEMDGMIQIEVVNENKENRRSFENNVEIQQSIKVEIEEDFEIIQEEFSPNVFQEVTAMNEFPLNNFNSSPNITKSDNHDLESTDSSSSGGSRHPEDDSNEHLTKSIHFNNAVEVVELSSTSDAASIRNGKKSFWMRFICGAN